MDSALVRKLLRRQAALAAFGTFALRTNDLPTVLDEAARVCADGFGVPYSKVCRFRPDENDLIIEAGHGWAHGVIGFVVPHADDRTPQGRAFSTRRPVICADLQKERDFALPRFYAQHGIRSTVDVIIHGNGHPYGVLEIDSDEQRDYDQHDVDFLTGFANVLGEAVATAQRIAQLAETLAEMRLLVDEKNRLLDQKKTLAQELQHRVRNNLQLVYGMLDKHADDTSDAAGRSGLKSIARRVFTLSHVYDQLLGTDMSGVIDFSPYLCSLCENLLEVQAAGDRTIRLESSCDPTRLDLDVVTSLGIIVTELVTNSFDHAFSSGEGLISVALRHQPGAAVAILTIGDTGCGFVPGTESKRHGVGLVRRLIEQIGGHATIDWDHGTVWTITFPVEHMISQPPLETSTAVPELA